MLARYMHLANADAERALLKASGFPVPEAVEIGRLDFPDESLRPIVPVGLPPATDDELRHQHEEAIEFANRAIEDSKEEIRIIEASSGDHSSLLELVRLRIAGLEEFRTYAMARLKESSRDQNNTT